MKKTPFQKYNEKSKKLYDELALLQTLCAHPEEHITKKYKSSTGNYYDKDEYWIEFTCGYCGKWWSTPQ